MFNFFCHSFVCTLFVFSYLQNSPLDVSSSTDFITIHDLNVYLFASFPWHGDCHFFLVIIIIYHKRAPARVSVCVCTWVRTYCVFSRFYFLYLEPFRRNTCIDVLNRNSRSSSLARRLRITSEHYGMERH